MMAKKPNRTPSGSPSTAARDATGGGKGMRPGSFPVFDTKSGHDALDLRGRAPDPKAVVNKVARFANRTDNTALKSRVARVRAAAKRGK